MSLLVLAMLLTPTPRDALGLLIENARATGALLLGDTSVLVALGGEEACAASEDREDCEATRADLPEDGRYLLLEGVDGLALPPLAGSAPSLLLPTYPYGLDEYVSPTLQATPSSAPSELQRTRIYLPPRALPFFGPVGVALLGDPGDPHLRDAKSGSLVLLDLRLRALRVTSADGRTTSWAWSGASAPTGDALLLPDAAQLGLTLRGLEPALSMCARIGARTSGAFLRGRGKPRRLEGEPLLALSIAPDGTVRDAALLAAPWEDRDVDLCIEANARLLRLQAPGADTVGISRLHVDSAAGTAVP
jgi:hypothetical protein